MPKYFKKLIFKLYYRYVIDDLVQVEEIDETKRMEAYAALYQNTWIMNVFQRMLVADTKEMMKVDWNDDKTRAIRYGMFVRTKAIIDKAKELYIKSNGEEPEDTK
jgi:hypothetical protein